MGSKIWRLAEAAGLTVAALTVTVIVTNLETPFFENYAALITAACWLYLPIIILSARRESLEPFALNRLVLLSSLFWAAMWILLTFPPFYLAWGWGEAHFFGYHWRFRIPDEILQVIVFQFLAIAIPEELFFRGYLQGRLNQIFGRPWRLWGTSIGPGLFIAAVVFSLCHLFIEANWLRLAVFFPAMLMGWMREKNNSIIAPVIFHALSNISFVVAQAGLYQI